MPRPRAMNKQPVVISCCAGAAVVIWVALKIAPSVGNGLPAILNAISTLGDDPFRLSWSEYSIQTVGVLLLIYGMCILYWISFTGNYRHGEEHGSARWETPRALSHRLANHKEPDNNLLLTQNLKLSTDQQKLHKNLFVLVLGGSGAGKTRYYLKPNIMQCNSSMVILDPKGELSRDEIPMLKKEGYRTVIFDLLDMANSYRWNPFPFFRTDNDVQVLITNLFANTTEKTQHSTSDPFFENSAKMMLSAFMYLVWYEAPPEEQNFGTVMELIRAEEIPEEADESFQSPVKLLFEDLRKRSPDHIAVRYFDSYSKGAGVTVRSIQATLIQHMEKFNIDEVVRLTTGNEIDIPRIGSEKTALFIRMPDNDTSFNFLASMLITQIFQVLMHEADNTYREQGGRLPVPVHIMLEEMKNITLPADFVKWQATVRSRNIRLSLIFQDLSQIKSMFPQDWESVAGLCDEILFLGGNETSSHEWISKLLGQETIDTNTFGFSRGRNGSSSKNMQNAGRALLDISEVRLKDKMFRNPRGAAIAIIANEYPTVDQKYDLMQHPRIGLTADGGAPVYSLKDDTERIDRVMQRVYVNEQDISEDEITVEIEMDEGGDFRIVEIADGSDYEY